MSSLRRVTRAARERLPDPVTGALRSGQLLVGRATHRWRPPPEVVVVGAQRCGTTTLFRLLSDHPDVMRPSFSKGIGFFDLEYRRGMRWYRAHFPLRRPAWLFGRRARRLTFESSGYYCYHPLAAERIARDLPGVRVVMLVRDPVERAWSAYKHERARGFEDLDFEEALDREPERLSGEVERLRTEPGYRSFEHRHHSYLARGRYFEQVTRLQAALGSDRVRVVDAGRFFEDPAAEFTELTEWLGLPGHPPESVDRWNARPGDLEPALRRRLEEYFAPHDRALAGLVGWTPSWMAATAVPGRDEAPAGRGRAVDQG